MVPAGGGGAEGDDAELGEVGHAGAGEEGAAGVTVADTLEKLTNKSNGYGKFRGLGSRIKR